MTREDIKKEFPDATEEQITALLNINGNDIETWKKKVSSEYTFRCTGGCNGSPFRM